MIGRLLPSQAWHFWQLKRLACQSTASKYSHSIANLFRKLTIITQESPTMRTLTCDFIAAFHCLMSSLMISSKAGTEQLQDPSSLLKSPSQFRGQSSLLVSLPAGLSLSISMSRAPPSSGGKGAGCTELMREVILTTKTVRAVITSHNVWRSRRRLQMRTQQTLV